MHCGGAQQQGKLHALASLCLSCRGAVGIACACAYVARRLAAAARLQNDRGSSAGRERACNKLCAAHVVRSFGWPVTARSLRAYFTDAGTQLDVLDGCAAGRLSQLRLTRCRRMSHSRTVRHFAKLDSAAKHSHVPQLAEAVLPSSTTAGCAILAHRKHHMETAASCASMTSMVKAFDLKEQVMSEKPLTLSRLVCIETPTDGSDEAMSTREETLSQSQGPQFSRRTRPALQPLAATLAVACEIHKRLGRGRCGCPHLAAPRPPSP